VSDKFTWTALNDGYKMAPLPEASYGDVEQRWIMIHSEKAAFREGKTLEKNIQKEKDATEKMLWHLGNKVFKCAHDAETALHKEIKKMHHLVVASSSDENDQAIPRFHQL
jgi:transposase